MTATRDMTQFRRGIGIVSQVPLMDRVPSPDRKVLLSPDYKEEQLRAEFLNPFLTALGWDWSGKPSLHQKRAHFGKDWLLWA